MVRACSGCTRRDREIVRLVAQHDDDVEQVRLLVLESEELRSRLELAEKDRKELEDEQTSSAHA